MTNTTGALVAQGTVTGILLAGLVWAGVGLLGLLLLWIFLLILLGILCSMLDCVCQCSGCACEENGSGCGPCDPCGGCCGPCDPCGGCCDGCEGCGDCGCDCGGGSSAGGGGGGGTGGDCGCLLPAASVKAADGQTPRRVHLAHHPDLPAYREDVYVVRGHRLCIGCFTTYPVFALLAGVLFLLQPVLPWAVALGVGTLLASLQGVSSLGRARTRLQKGLVKSALGSGLALYTYGALTSPLGFWGQYGLLWLAVGLAMASTVPRTIRMRRARAHSSSCRCDGTPGPDAAHA